jgi:hypothetical protein
VTWKKAYSISADFSNGVEHEKFLAELAASSIETEVERIREDENTFEIWFASEPTPGEKSTADSVVAAHDGLPPAKFLFHTSSKIVEGAKQVTEQDWEDLGGTVTTLTAFMPNTSKAWGRVVGQAKVSGSGAQLKVSRSSDGADITPAPHSIGDTSGEWANLQFWANQNQPENTDAFVLKGRLNGATSFEVRFVSMSLLEKIQ